MVMTYEASPGGLRAVHETTGLAEASGALPAGAYTTLRTYRSRRVLRMADHVRRLSESAGVPLEEARVREALREALGRSGHAESRVRLTFAPPRLFVSVEPFQPLPPALYQEGVRCATVGVQRSSPHAKDTRFIATADTTYRVLPPGVYEGLLLAADGAILEGLSSNFFGIRDGVLRTEPDRVLLGVTRSLVLEAAAGLLPVDPRAVHLDELPRLAECFITSASRGVLPVVQVDATVVGQGRPGPLTRELRQRFEQRIEQEAQEV